MSENVPRAFCGICNSRFFQSYNGREFAMCGVCGSLERQRAFILALLAWNLEPQMRLALLTRNAEKPRYFSHLSNICSVEILPENEVDKTEGCYDFVYHDHLLHGSVPYIGLSDYVDLVPQIDMLLKLGGVQLFSVGVGNHAQKILGTSSDKIEKSMLCASTHSASPRLESKVAMVFDLTQHYGNDIAARCLLGKWSPQKATGDCIFFRHKPSE